MKINNSKDLDVLGAALPPPLGDPRAVLVKLRDIPALIKQQGGSVGAGIASLSKESSTAGGMVSALVYGKIQEELQKGFKEKGVDADVQVVVPTGYVPAGSNPVWKPLAITTMATGGAYVLYRILYRIFRKKG